MLVKFVLSAKKDENVIENSVVFLKKIFVKDFIYQKLWYIRIILYLLNGIVFFYYI